MKSYLFNIQLNTNQINIMDFIISNLEAFSFSELKQLESKVAIWHNAISARIENLARNYSVNLIEDFKCESTIVKSLDNPNCDYVCYYLGVAIRFFFNSQYHTIWVNFYNNHWIKLYQTETKCQGCIENQPNQLAHSCLTNEIILYPEHFNITALDQLAIQFKSNKTAVLDLFDYIINRNNS